MNKSVESLVRQMFLACCTGPTPGGEGQYVDTAVVDYSLSLFMLADVANGSAIHRAVKVRQCASLRSGFWRH
jgi:hypothetical protein